MPTEATCLAGVENLVEQYSGWLPEQMLNHFREALAADPDHVPSHVALADVLRRLGQDELATASARRADELREQARLFGP